MTPLTSSELVRVQEHLRSCLALSRFCNHVANETSDQQLKGLCSQMMQNHQRGYERIASFITGAPQTH